MSSSRASTSLKVQPENDWQPWPALRRPLSRDGSLAESSRALTEKLSASKVFKSVVNTATELSEVGLKFVIENRYLLSHRNLADALLKLGKPNEAIRHYSESLRLQPLCWPPACCA